MLSLYRSPIILWLCLIVSISCKSFDLKEELNTQNIYITPSELELFRNSLEFIKGERCRQDLNATLWGLMNNAQWAISMYDASVRNPVGIESSVLYQFGHYDQCLKTYSDTAFLSRNDDVQRIVQTQYCLVDVAISGVIDGDEIFASDSVTIKTLISHWGECVPAVCSGDDVAIYLQHILQRNVTVNADMCQSIGQHVRPLTNGMMIYALIISFFVLLTILSTAYHIYWLRSTSEKDEVSISMMKRNKFINMALFSFSLIENSKKLFQASRDQQGLNPINGIKAISMVLILSGHAATFIYGVQVYNEDFFTENIKYPWFSYLTNSLLFVDVFLMLGGYLLFRILFVELEKRRGKLNPLILYIGRYIRLTPAYLVVIGFYCTWFKSVGSGPLWQYRLKREEENCQASWWLNILYINNYFNTEKLCMFQSWYLSADTQLFMISSLFIYLIYKYRKFGLNLLIASAVGTSLIPFIVTYMEDLPPTFLINAKEAEYIQGSNYFRNTYIKTHMRASSYLIGVLTGYTAHQIQNKSIRIPKSLLRLLWAAACILGSGALLSIFRFYAYPYSNAESTLYAGFHKLAWNIAISFFILSVTTGHCVWLQRFLSFRVFVPFSRLTYCAFLANGLIELLHTSAVRSPEYLNYIKAENFMLGHSADTFMLAFILCLVFESPIHALERILLRSSSSGERNKTPSQSSSDGSACTTEDQVA